jgi:hypothetical protein
VVRWTHEANMLKTNDEIDFLVVQKIAIVREAIQALYIAIEQMRDENPSATFQIEEATDFLSFVMESK